MNHPVINTATLPETNSSHEKIGRPKEKLVFQPSILRIYQNTYGTPPQESTQIASSTLWSLSNQGCASAKPVLGQLFVEIYNCGGFFRFIGSIATLGPMLWRRSVHVRNWAHSTKKSRRYISTDDSNLFSHQNMILGIASGYFFEKKTCKNVISHLFIKKNNRNTHLFLPNSPPFF